MTFMVKFNSVNWLMKSSLGQDRDLGYTSDRHPIRAPSRTVSAQWFYCSMNPSQHLELYLLLRTPCCARTHSIAIDLITSKVRYSLGFTAELFTSGLLASVTHARYANSTSSSADASSLWKFGRSKHGIVISGIHAHARHATFSTWHRISKHYGFA